MRGRQRGMGALLGVAVLAAWVAGGCSNRAPGSLEGGAASASSTAPAREFAVEGMTCEGCAGTVTAAIEKIKGVQSAKVFLQEKKAVVVGDPVQVPAEKIEAAIAAAGYEGKLIAPGP